MTTSLYWHAPGTRAFIRTAHFPSSTYVGASQAFASLYREIELDDTDIIAVLAGGTFVRTDTDPYGNRMGDTYVFEARFSPNCQHLFERGPVRKDPVPEGTPAPALVWASYWQPWRWKPFTLDWTYQQVRDAGAVPFGAMDYHWPLDAEQPVFPAKAVR
ncbi:hypothetical protein [Desertimonas flava]|uniref:hypothetical protein n=1 Tax=Desertimonas flava TaxID=2064846 RepID=UPI000E353324|nr:hypothetical protein [Desertimonas flava]